MKLHLTILSLMFSVSAWAGPSTSGGGFAVVCRDGNQKIKTAELLDLYEAKHLHGFELINSSGDEVKDYLRSVKNGYRLQGYNPPVTDDEIKKNRQNFYNIVNWIPSDEQLPNLNDIGKTVAVPAGCKIEPLAIFYDTQGVVSIDKSIWETLDTLSRAALITHEITYNYFRSMKLAADTTSEESRTLTAMNFSKNITPVKSGLPPGLKENSIFHSCMKTGEFSRSCDQPSEYYIFDGAVDETGNPLLRVQFTYLAGRPLIALTVLDLPHAVSFGQVFKVQSQQLHGWTAEVAQDTTSAYGIKLVIKRDNIFITELPL
jgi:hypothetical protein